jgi:hypothetical protein
VTAVNVEGSVAGNPCKSMTDAATRAVPSMGTPVVGLGIQLQQLDAKRVRMVAMEQSSVLVLTKRA